jgi:hypothetical protein
MIVPYYVVSCVPYRVAYCEGRYPEFMIDAWDEYDYRKDSDNDRPGDLSAP